MENEDNAMKIKCAGIFLKENINACGKSHIFNFNDDCLIHIDDELFVKITCEKCAVTYFFSYDVIKKEARKEKARREWRKGMIWETMQNEDVTKLQFDLWFDACEANDWIDMEGLSISEQIAVCKTYKKEE